MTIAPSVFVSSMSPPRKRAKAAVQGKRRAAALDSHDVIGVCGETL
jgi:hypothetical protein